MSIPKLKPYQPDPYIKLATDQEIAKFGHLNWLIGQINQIAVGGIQSVVAGTDITIDNTDPQNPIINSTGGGSQDLDQTLFIGDDANQQNIVNLNTLQGGSAILLTITDDNSGGILLNPTGPATLGSVGDLSTFTSGNGFVFQGLTTNEIDASSCTKITIPQIVLSAGLVGTPSLTFVGQTDMGNYKISATQMGTSIGGTLVGGWNAAGLFTSTVSEQITNGGVQVVGAAGGDGSYILKINPSTGVANVGTQIQLEQSDTPTLLASGNIWNDSVSKGLSFQDGNNNTVTIIRNTGWTASAGTLSKAGIDSDDVIYTVGALQNLARTVAAIQNTLMNTHGLFGT